MGIPGIAAVSCGAAGKCAAAPVVCVAVVNPVVAVALPVIALGAVTYGLVRLFSK